MEYPEAFFYKKVTSYFPDSTYIFHRKLQTISRNLLKKIEANASIRIMQIDSLLDGIELKPLNDFFHMDIENYNYNAEEIARLLRAKWNIPAGPIKNLIEVIENAGGFVFKCDFETRKIDGLSMWSKITPPIFFINRDIPTDRFRFSLAHELGHIIMHRLPTENLEREANKFASEFLMPESDVIHDIRLFSLQKAVALKSKWKVSIASL